MKRSSLAVDAGFFLLLVGVPLAWSSVFIAEFTLAKLVTLNVALAMAAWGAAFRPDALAAGKTDLDLPLLAGLIVAGLSAAASADPSTSLRGRYDSYAYGLWGLALLAAVVQLAARSARGRETVRARWLIWSAALVGGYGVLQKLGFDPIFHIKNLPTGGRAVSTLGSPVDLGALLALACPLSLWRVDTHRRASSAAAVMLIAGGLIACGSRGAMLAAAVGSAAYWLMSRRRAGGSLRPSLGVAIAAVAAALLWSWRPGASVVDVARREVWRSASTAFLQNPWLGVGLDGFEDAFRRLRSDQFVAVMGSSHHQAYPHNDLLMVLSGLGLLGAAVYAWLLASLAKAARRALETESSRSLAAALAAGLLALWVNMEFNPVSLEVLAFAAVAMGLLTSLSSASPVGLPRLLLLSAGALSTVSLVCALGVARADVVFKKGAWAQAGGDFATARRLFAQARTAAPCELAYILAEVNALGDWINATHVVDERLALLALADADGRAAVSCHPRQSTSHYIAAAAARMHADLGFKDQLVVAAREFDAALALDPKFGPLLEARREVSRVGGLK
jgi:O-antigen ligase